ncbi:MAG: hypothetical protein HZA17_10645 [Nitrospirae bacterium]|nr:hypothetical protein [Nitrospirota bacterium]
MENFDTIAELFRRAISIEKKAGVFYQGLSKKFSNHPAVSDFWKTMMHDEAEHAGILQNILDSLSEERREETVDVSVMNISKEEVDYFSSVYSLLRIETLDDAYELAFRLESSEINSKVQSLISNYVPSEKRASLILSVLKDHISRLDDFSKLFGNEERRKSVMAEGDLFSS